MPCASCKSRSTASVEGLASAPAPRANMTSCTTPERSVGEVCKKPLLRQKPVGSGRAPQPLATACTRFSGMTTGPSPLKRSCASPITGMLYSPSPACSPVVSDRHSGARAFR